MKFSIIIPVYNVAPYLEKCLDSLLNQNYNNYEIILVNDGSTDDSLEICKEYESKFSNIIVISQSNQGSGPARNAGMEVAQGDYLYFCDPDDYLAEDFLNHAENYIKSEPELVVFSYWDVQKSNGQIINKILVNIEEDKQLNRDEFRKNFVELFSKNLLYTLWNKLYRRDFLTSNKVEFTAASMGQDTRFNLKLYPLVSDVQLVKEPFYHYFSNRDGSSTEKYREDRIKLQLEEVELLEDVLAKINQIDHNLLNKLKLNIVLGNSHHIANSNIEMKEKIKALERILRTDSTRKILEENVDTANLSLKLLKNNRTKLYLTLKSIQNRIIK
ncbi:glycosyltransferase family 2 protein [Aerococcus urinaeequi]|uniref:glycosyltransferase family 2 protein n=1 Tax=Aerococcus urinaeequi TaxID=51665 RepID=UPI003D6C1CE9